MGSRKIKVTQELPREERSKIVEIVKKQLERLEWKNLKGIEKLKKMLVEFEEKGRQFDTCVRIPQLQNRLLDVKLFNDKNRMSHVYLRSSE